MLSDINPDDITAPISVSHYCQERGISFRRDALLQAVRNLGIRAELLPYPVSSGALKEQVVMLPHDYDIEQYPYETIPQQVLKALPATRAALRAKTRFDAKQIDNALVALYSKGQITKFGSVYKAVAHEQ